MDEAIGVRDVVVLWYRVMMKRPWRKLPLLLHAAPLPPGVARINEYELVRRHWARLQTYHFVLCAAVPQSVALLPLIGCNLTKALCTTSPCSVLFWGWRVGGSRKEETLGRRVKRMWKNQNNNNKKTQFSLYRFLTAGHACSCVFSKSWIWNIKTLDGLDSMFFCCFF